VTLENVADLAA